MSELPTGAKTSEERRSTWRGYVSPPPGARDSGHAASGRLRSGAESQPRRPGPSASHRASDLLFQWETREFGIVRRNLIALWRNSRRRLLIAGLAATLILLGAAAVADPDLEQARRALLDRLLQVEHTVKAREGELALARLELNRLNAIHEYSKKHRIPADLAASIYDIALAEGIEPGLAFSLVRVESGFARRAVSSAGAVGLTQLMPSTAFWLQPDLSYNDLFERDTNLRVGFRYLKMLLTQYDGDLHLALLAYNRGPARVDDILEAGGDPSNGYSRVVRAGATPVVQD